MYEMNELELLHRNHASVWDRALCSGRQLQPGRGGPERLAATTGAEPHKELGSHAMLRSCVGR